MITLLKNISNKIWIGLGVIILFFLCISYSEWKTKQVNSKILDAKEQIAEANAKLNAAYEIIDKMHDEHEAALETANTALKERVKIYEKARERICEAEKKIGGNTDFCDQFVPDDIIMLWKKQDAERISKNPVSASD